MLPDAGEVHEPEVDRRHLALTDQGQDLFRCHRAILRAVHSAHLIDRQWLTFAIDSCERPAASSGNRRPIAGNASAGHAGIRGSEVEGDPDASQSDRHDDPCRFVVLGTPWNGVHWDFMLETRRPLCGPGRSTRRSSAATTCRRGRWPTTGLAYLDYEGPISGGRGTVRRVDRGVSSPRLGRPTGPGPAGGAQLVGRGRAPEDSSDRAGRDALAGFPPGERGLKHLARGQGRASDQPLRPAVGTARPGGSGRADLDRFEAARRRGRGRACSGSGRPGGRRPASSGRRGRGRGRAR